MTRGRIALLFLGVLAACGGATPPPPAVTTTTLPPAVAGGAGLREGAEAPDFELPADDGTTFRLSSLRGAKPIVLYFYPKDETPGCTKQACAYRDASDSYAARGIAIYGVSVDDTASHAAFRAHHRLNFPLLSDAGGEVAKKFNVLGENGRAKRTTFVIGLDGRIFRVLGDVDPTTDPSDALAAFGD